MVGCRLVENGQTALGPGLLLSVAIAARSRGSKVVICTDGLANVGLGSMDRIDMDSVYEDACNFYSSITDLAVQGG